MSRSKRKLVKLSRSKQLYERAVFCKRLAAGAAHPKFAATLQALADEYEGEAARAAARMEQPEMPQDLDGTRAASREHQTG